MLKDGSEKEIPLKNGSCKINASSSWYIDCQGKMVPLSVALARDTFMIEQESHGYNFEVKNMYIKLYQVIACLLHFR